MKWDNKNITILLLLAMLTQIFIPIFNIVGYANREENKYISHNEPIISEENCERIIEGSINLTIPEKEEKGIDLVIVQDASGSFENTIKDMKAGLKQLVKDNLDFDKDRVMISTFNGGNIVNYFRHQEYFNYYKKGDYDKYLNYPYNYYKLYKDQQIHLADQITHRWVPVTKQDSGLTDNINEYNKFVDDFDIGGATPTPLGLKYALEKYEESKGDNTDRETIFLLVTDGIANVDLNGNINILDPYNQYQFHESKQFYKLPSDQTLEMAEEIKDKGYHFITTFIEDEEFLRSDYQYKDNYDEVRKYASDKLQKTASKPEYYINFDTPEKFSNDVGSILKDLIATLNENKLELNLDEDYELINFGIKGEELFTSLDEENNKLIIGLDNLKPGDYTFEYKLKETEFIDYDKEILSGKLTLLEKSQGSDEKFSKIEKILAPVSIEGNTNEVCEYKPKIEKKVNGEHDIELENLDEEFTYTVDVNIENLYGIDYIEITDEVDSLLEISENSVNLTISSEDIKETELLKKYYNEEVDNNKITIYIEKHNLLKFINSVSEEDSQLNNDILSRGKLQLKFKAKIKEDLEIEDIEKKYKDLKIPNKAKLKFGDDKEKELESNEVYVKVLTRIEILKQDMDNKPLSGVKFNLVREGSNDSYYGISNKEGKIIFNNLKEGVYTLEETETLEGYEKLKDPIKLKVTKEGKIELQNESEDDKYLLKNNILIIKNKKELVDIKIEKRWKGLKGEEKVKVKLYNDNDEPVKDSKGKDLEITLSNDNSWTDIFKGLPKYDDEGNEIKYTVKEFIKKDEETVEVTETDENKTGYTLKVTGNIEEGFTITNTKVKPEEPTEPGEEDPNKPGEEDPNKPGEEDPNKPGEEDPNKPGEEDPNKPGEEDPNKPGEEDPNKPGEEDPNKPGEEDPNKPGEEDPNKPGEEDPNKPGGEEPTEPTEPENPDKPEPVDPDEPKPEKPVKPRPPKPIKPVEPEKPTKPAPRPPRPTRPLKPTIPEKPVEEEPEEEIKDDIIIEEEPEEEVEGEIKDDIIIEKPDEEEVKENIIVKEPKDDMKDDVLLEEEKHLPKTGDGLNASVYGLITLALGTLLLFIGLKNKN